MRRTITIQPRFYSDTIPGLALAASFQFGTAVPGQLLQVIELAPVPPGGEVLLNDLGLALGFGVAANLLRSEPGTTRLVLILDGSAHPAWQAVAGLFTELSGIPLRIQAEFTPAVLRPRAKGPVFLLSGGKDTLYMLDRAQQAGLAQGCPAVYLGAGSELNWRDEIVQVRRRAQHFQLQCRHVHLYQMLVSTKGGLHFGNRAAWRELVTLTLARCFGDHIFTGINNDAIAQLRMRDPHYLDFLSQLLPVVEALAQILGAHIETAPGELEVYRETRHHPLFERSGSCLRLDCGRPHLCAKCRVFDIYDRVLAGVPLSLADVQFIHSDQYIGDATLLSLFPLPERSECYEHN